jgi:hypothetical protein
MEMTCVPAGKIEGVLLQRFAGVLAVGPCTGKEMPSGGKLSLLSIHQRCEPLASKLRVAIAKALHLPGGICLVSWKDSSKVTPPQRR